MRAEAHARAVVELVCPVAQVVAGPDGRILWWNAAADEQFDGRLGFDVGIDSLTHQDDAIGEALAPARDADERWCYACERPATGPDGRTYRVLFLIYV